MRFAAPAAVLAGILAVTSSISHGQESDPSPRAAALIMRGDAALQAGDTQAAIDAYEAALVVDPGYSPLFLSLARAARADGLQGKAIAYYRELLERDPRNFAAISGEGEALLEKGAIAKARRNLAQLQSLCGQSCVETRQLAAAIERGAQPRLVAAESVMPEATVTQN